MKVRIYYYHGDDWGEIEYFSKFNRINARGIKEEVKNELYLKLGKGARYCEITNITRAD